MSETTDLWVMQARWQLGKLSDDEYADYLCSREELNDDPLAQMLIDELRTRKRPRDATA